MKKNTDKNVYYRYSVWKGQVCVGELFCSIQPILGEIHQMANEGSIFSLEDYSDINSALQRIVNMLNRDNISSEYGLVVNKYTRSKIIGNIETIDAVLKDYGYNIREHRE